MNKTAIFGGTFNPFHLGHLKLMDEVILTVSPDRLIVVPAHIPPHKQSEELMSDSDRLEMCRLAVFGRPGVEVSDFEILKGGKSYTVYTLEHFHKINPEDELYLAMGSDMFISFHKWYRSERMAELATIVCNCRDEADRERISEAKSRIENSGGRCLLTECTPLVCSSTDIRRRLSENKPIDSLVPATVAEYIERKGLYRD